MASATPGTQGSGTGVIPGAGIYGQEQQLAQLAYDNAVAAAQNNKRKAYAAAGMTDQGVVDPNNPYGGYQQLLGSEGRQLDQAQNYSDSRNLWGMGLGHQPERTYRYSQAVTNLGFANGINDIANQYASAMKNADFVRQQAMLQALQNAFNSNWGNWGPTGGDTSGDGTDPNAVTWGLPPGTDLGPDPFANYKGPSVSSLMKGYGSTTTKRPPARPPVRRLAPGGGPGPNRPMLKPPTRKAPPKPSYSPGRR